MPLIILGCVIGAIFNVVVLDTTVSGAILIAIIVVVVLGAIREFCK